MGLGKPVSPAKPQPRWPGNVKIDRVKATSRPKTTCRRQTSLRRSTIAWGLILAQLPLLLVGRVANVPMQRFPNGKFLQESLSQSCRHSLAVPITQRRQALAKRGVHRRVGTLRREQSF